MNDPEKPMLQPVVNALAIGMANPRSNIAAVHFDGPGLDGVLMLYVEHIEMEARRRLGR